MMIANLDERYASCTAASRISILTRLYRSNFTGGSIEKHVDRISSLLAQLERMGPNVAVPETHKGPLLLASVGLDSGFESTAAALRTKNPDAPLMLYLVP